MISVPTRNSRRRTNEYMNERVRMYAYFPSVSCCWSTSDQIATTIGDDERRATNDDERNDDERKNDVTRCTRASERATREKRETQQTCSPKRSFSFAPHFEQTMYFIFLSRSLIRFRCELCLIRSHHVGQQRSTKMDENGMSDSQARNSLSNTPTHHVWSLIERVMEKQRCETIRHNFFFFCIILKKNVVSWYWRRRR